MSVFRPFGAERKYNNMHNPLTNIKRYRLSIDNVNDTKDYIDNFFQTISEVCSALKYSRYLLKGATLPKPISLVDPACEVVTPEGVTYKIQLWEVAAKGDTYEFIRVKPMSIQEALEH